MNAMNSARRRPARRVVGLCLAAAGIVLVPRIALAADGGAPTIRAQIGSNGAVQSAKQYTPDGASGAFGGQLPITMKITHTASGAAQTFSYHVENTFSQTQTVNFTDTAGHALHTTMQLQLPLVAQLGVDVPKSMGAVNAGTGSLTTTADGTRHVLWNMVLFTPLGSSVQDVSLTTTAAGNPVAELHATAVDPQNAAGLSNASQTATANYQQDDFWAGYANGADGGLTQLATGLVKLFAGAAQLHAGIATGASGANQLDAGAATAYAGSKKLRDGIGKVHTGQGQLTTGLNQIYGGQGDLTKGLLKIHSGQGALTAGISKVHDGQVSLTGGISQIHDGQVTLTGGISQIHDGQVTLTSGLAQISGGLGQLADPATGLPAAVVGIQQLIDGASALLAGVGDDATANTLLNGVTLVQGGLSQLQAGIQANAGCAVDVLTKLRDGVAAPGVADVCVPGGAFPPVPAFSDPFAIAVITGLITQFSAVSAGTDATLQAAFGQLAGGLTAIHHGLSHSPAGADPGGIKEGIAALKAGLGLLKTGVQTASTGATALNAGAATALTGSQALVAGSGGALAGSQLLVGGSTLALGGSQALVDGSALTLTGSKALTAGSAAALDGSVRLLRGSGTALIGSKKLYIGTGADANEALGGARALARGLGKISAGQHQVATGLPAAVSGSGQIADGLNQVITGVKSAQSGAVGPLAKQLGQASENAHRQLAVLQGAAALAAQGPGGTGATYVLSQSTKAFSLAADVKPVSASSSSHTARNVGIGVGGFALLLLGLGGGFAMGRTRRRSAA
jgi:X-X-X-Leu-X-X-Gly heptad repeat protein